MMLLSLDCGGVHLKRRIFLATAAGATAACSRGTFQASSLRVLTVTEAATLDAWVETLIPADEDAGALDAGVTNFIDIQLTKRYKKLKRDYSEALAGIDKLAARMKGTSFVSLSLDDRTTILIAMEFGRASKDIFPDGGKAAFEMVLAHTQQGFYGNPRHGGNKDYTSWRMLGVAPLQVRGRQHYQVAETYPAGDKS